MSVVNNKRLVESLRLKTLVQNTENLIGFD